MKNQTCFFTGHRDIADDSKIKLSLREQITGLIKQGVQYFIAGGALGFDTLAALTVLELRTAHPHIKLILALPCRSRGKFWSTAEKNQYREVIEKTDEIIYVSEYYFRGCMHKRNRYMADRSKYCIAYCVKNNGGTFYTVNYAAQSGCDIVNIADSHV